MYIVCCDLEGVFVPEIWINVAEKTQIEKLRLTTRDIPDYDVLMRGRLEILKEHNLKIQDIRDVIAGMEPLEGAADFLGWLRQAAQVIIVSDTFTQFAGPLMAKLGYPTLLCNTLVIDKKGTITDYSLRQPNGKRHVAIAFKSLYYKVVGIGDSYNDISMLEEADAGILFRPPPSIRKEYAQFPVTHEYEELRSRLRELGIG